MDSLDNKNTDPFKSSISINFSKQKFSILLIG